MRTPFQVMRTPFQAIRTPFQAIRISFRPSFHEREAVRERRNLLRSIIKHSALCRLLASLFCVGSPRALPVIFEWDNSPIEEGFHSIDLRFFAKRYLLAICLHIDEGVDFFSSCWHLLCALICMERWTNGA